MSNDYNGKKRSELPDSVFGIPQERKYPMPDEKHTRSAIKLFNHVDPKYEEQLAKAIIKNMKKYGIDGSAVGPNNRLRKYLPEDMIKESMDSLLYEYMYTDNDPDIIIQESGYALTWRIMPILFKAVLSGVDQYDYKYLREKKLPAILKKCKTMDDIKYMRRDAITAKTQLEILKRNVHAVNANDEQIMKRLNKSFIKKVKDGKITEKEIDTHIRWLGTEYKKLIDARAKEIKDSIKESYIEEGYFRSTDNLEFNLDKWSKSGNHNLLYITGISGSGKTTLAKEMCKKYKAEYIELDKFTLGIVKGLDRWFENVNNGTYEVHPLLKEYFSQLDHLTTNGSWSKPDMGNEHDKFLTWLIKKVKGNGTLYIVEGAQFFMKLSNMDPDLIKGEPLIVVGTSAFKSWIRRIKRDTANDETISRFIYHLKKDVPMLFKYYFSNEKDLQKYIKNMQSNVNESVSSTVSKDHKQKGYISLSSLKKVHITESVINKYKKEYPVLRHVRCKDTNEYICDGYMWFKENDLVCYVGSCQYTDDHTKWIVSLEIIPKYRGYGLSNQILDYCVKSMKCKYLSVNKNNELAKKIYDKYGFRVYHEDKTMYYMTLDSIIKESSSRKITTVVFDLGDVLIKSNMQEKLRKNPKIPNQQIYPLLEKWFDDDLDLLSKEEYIDTISKRLAPDFSDIVPDIVDAFSDIEVLSYTIPTLKDLKERGYNIYYLSNWSRWGVEILRENNKLDFLSLFDGGLFSYEVGVKKPDRKIYDAFLKKFKINPKEAIFVDNKKKNIDAAEKFGIKGVLFSNEKDLQKCIKNMQSNVNESYIEESSNNKVYHLSQTNLDGKTIQPTVPSNYMTKNGYEDGKTKRVCFATSIDGCLRGLSLKCEGMKLFVHVPDGNYNIYKPSNKEVPDASITGEVWIKKAVKMKCIGQIYVIGDKGEDGIPYKYGDKTAELYDWEWKWIDKFNESSSIFPQDTGISTVIFDIGDVLVSANIKDYLVADPEIPNEIVDELLKLWFIEKDEVDDTMDLDTYREIVNKRMGVEFSKYIPKLFKYNVDCVTAFDYTIPMIQDLKDKGYKVYYLSNWSAWTHDLLQEAGKFDFLKLMDGGVFSYDVGYMKPNEEIYKILLNKYKINPEEAIFFDDREENIEAANKLGIHGIHFPRHDASIVYNNLYGRKLAKAIYEDMDNIRYDFDHSYNDKVFGIPSIQESKTNKKPLYFYHMVNSDANLSKGLLSLGYMYHHDKSLFLKNANKYRNRLCDGWGIYPGRDPRSLTAEEIYEGIKKHRKEDNLNTIYFFKYPPYSTLDKRFDRLYKYKKLYRININDPKVKSIIKNIYYGWVDSNTDNDPLDRGYYETISPEDYFNNFDPDKGLLFSTLYHISIEVKNGYIPMRLLEEVKVPNTIEDIISIEESSIQEYGTTGGTIVGANQPDSVYIVNYMQNNVFSGYKEPKQAICKKGMNQMYTTKNGKAVPVDKDKFKEEASDISVFRFKETPILSFDKIIENASVDGDFYMLLTGDYPTNQHEIEYDNRFVQEENFLDELDDITCCTESTITGQIETSNYPYMKVLTESVQGRCWNYYRDINGVFAVNELTGLRTPSYENVIDIPKSQIKLIERGTVYLGK